MTNNSGSYTVSELRASDGALLGTFAVQRQPFGVAFDGANVWVTMDGGSVAERRASDGAPLGTFTVGGPRPEGVAFDGANIWVADNCGSTVTKL